VADNPQNAPPDAGPAQPTVVIAGYRLLRHMWSGQESQVYEVVETKSGRHFAMKILLQEKVDDPEAREHLFHEADTGQKLAHPNIIRIVSVCKDKKHPHFVMEFFPAGSLKLRLMRWEKEKEFIVAKAHDILKQTATALAFMHAKGYVHRDIKPENILVNNVGELRVIDFALTQKIPTGLSKLFWRRPRLLAGSRSYMSPEQIKGEPLDGRADIYCFACTAYELVTGRVPFRGASQQDLLKKHLHEKPLTPVAFNPDVTQEFADLVLRMLAKKREDRPPTFHEVLMALRALRIFKSADFKKPVTP
jgi:serine/threonine protein kinase